MYGQGIYFATDSSKSAREIYTQGSNKLLLCNVLIGKSLKLNKSDNQMTYKKLRSLGYDSVFAPRDTVDTGGVQNDEFVIFDPRQAVVRYIIHFQKGSIPRVPNLKAISQNSFEKIRLEASRKFSPEDPKCYLYK